MKSSHSNWMRRHHVCVRSRRCFYCLWDCARAGLESPHLTVCVTFMHTFLGGGAWRVGYGNSETLTLHLMNAQSSFLVPIKWMWKDEYERFKKPETSVKHKGPDMSCTTATWLSNLPPKRPPALLSPKTDLADPWKFLSLSKADIGKTSRATTLRLFVVKAE